jgi:hypothetical protein
MGIRSANRNFNVWGWTIKYPARLIRHLREEEEYNISEIWVGGEGNNDNGICLEVTARWIEEVAEAGGLDIDNLEKKGFRRVWR